MKIVMFTDSYYPRINGVTISVKTYAEGLAAIGHNVLIVACDFCDSKSKKKTEKCYYEDVDQKKSNLKVLRVPAHRVFFSEEDRYLSVEYWKYIEKELVNYAPNIVHMHTEFGAGLLARKYSKKYKIPLVYTFHTMWEDYVSNYVKFVPPTVSKYVVRKLLHYYFSHADLILCPTKRIKKIVTDYKSEICAEVFPTGISGFNSALNENEKKRIYNKLKSLIPDFDNKKKLLYAGRVAKEKNLNFLLQVVEKLSKEHNLVLILVGGGPELEKLKSETEKMNLSNQIFFLDYQPREDLQYYYSIADVFVFPSVTETQGLVTIESMMTGTPVVAIGEMGTVDVMQGNNGGFMVKHDLVDFCDKVEMLLKDKELYAEKSKQALEWSKNWDINDLVSKLNNMYESLV